MASPLFKSLLVIGMSFTLGIRTAIAEWNLPLHYSFITIFPHLVGIADIIFTGTPVATNDYGSAEFSVDDVIWGSVSGTNITVRDYAPDPYDPPYRLGERYLVGAFTNDWWKQGDYIFGPNRELLHFVPATNRSPTGVFLEHHMLVERSRSAIPFSRFDDNGTNYWEGTHALITNLIDIGRIQCDEGKVREIVESVVHDVSNSRRLPTFVRRQMILYKSFRYDTEDRAKPRDTHGFIKEVDDQVDGIKMIE